MKVFFFINNIPPDYGGGYLRVFKIAARFKANGELYRIATNTRSDVFPSNYLGVTKSDVIFCKNRVINSLVAIPWRMIMDRKIYDVFYVASTHWYTVIPSLTARLLKKKVVLGVTLSMTDSPASRPNTMLKVPYYWFKNSQFKCANYIFVNSPLLVEECKSCGYKDDVVKLINNPVDTSKFHPVTTEVKKQIRNNLGLPEEQFIILFVGSFNKRKGCDILPDVFFKVLKEIDRPITFVMCGQKGYPETETILTQLKVLFEETGSNLVIREEVRDTSLYYQASDLFLFPTTNEGMPNVVLEAMACGCMILCNRLPGITDYALEDIFMIEKNEVELYVNRIIQYISNPSIFTNEINNNIIKITKEFSIDSVDNRIKHFII